MKVEHWDAERDGKLTESALREKLERLGYESVRYEYPAGTYFSWHRHSMDKMDAVLSGRLRIAMAGESRILEAGDMAAVPADMEHEAEVVGSQPVISLDGMKFTP